MSSVSVRKTRSRSGDDYFANVEDAIGYLDGRINVERARPADVNPETLKLDRMRAMLGAMGNPEKQFKTVHVAGSKGKGSTSEMIAASLSGCGYATGLYTSPHLVDLTERIRIGLEPIAPTDFARALGHTALAAESVRGVHGEATYFELLTASAFKYFADRAVDVAVIEVGLGGRLDSTNVIEPEACAVTAIHLEHTQILGDTLEKIAREKAGIFKRGVPALTIPQAPGVLEAFQDIAQSVGAPLRVVAKDIDYSARFGSEGGVPHAKVCLSTPRSNFEHLVVPLQGEHQALNCGLALAVLDALRARPGFERITEREVSAGLARTPSFGRMELVSTAPRVIVDGAHNPESVHALVKAIGAHVRYDSMVLIFGCAADKNWIGMLQKLAMGADKVIFTRAANNPRSIDPRELSRKFHELTGRSAQVVSSVSDAIAVARQAVTRDDLICVTGSFYLAGEAKSLLSRERASRREPMPEPKPRLKARRTRRI